MGSSSSKEKTKVIPFTPEQKRTIAAQTDLARINLEELRRQRVVQAREFAQVENAIGRDFSQEFADRGFDIDRLTASRNEVLGIGLENVREGGQLTAEDASRIAQAEAAVRGSSTAQSRRGLESQVGLVNQALGSDINSRVLQGRFDVNQGINSSDILAQAAQSRMSQPLARSAGLQLGVQGLESPIREASNLQAQLQQRAFQNRLQLTGQRLNAGLDVLAAGIPSFTGLEQQTATKGKSSGFQLL